MQYTICEQKKNNFMESVLRIDNIQLEDEGSYSCATRLNDGGVSVSAYKTIIVLSNEKDEGMTFYRNNMTQWIHR